MNAEQTRIRVRLTPTEARRLGNRRARYAVRLECRQMRRDADKRTGGW